MKKILIRSIYVLLVLTIIFSINSCKKETSTLETKVDTKYLDIISEAKLHFENSLKEAPSNIDLFGNNEKNKFQLLGKKVLWDYAKTKKIKNGESVRIPILYDSESFIRAGKDKKAMSLYNLSYLMMYKDKKGKMQTEWVITIPDNDYVDRKRNSGIKFSGLIYILDWKGNFIKSYKITKDGKTYLSKTLSFNKINNSLQIQSESSKTTNGFYESCVTTDWYTCVGTVDAPRLYGCNYDESTTTCEYVYVDEFIPTGPESNQGGGTTPSDYAPEDPDCVPKNDPNTIISDPTNIDDCDNPPPPDIACLSSFQFSLINSGPGGRVCEVFGTFGAVVDRNTGAIIDKLDFGLHIEAPVTVENWNQQDHNTAHSLYGYLFQSGDIQHSYNNITGAESWNFSGYAQQVIARAAADYAAALVNKNLLKDRTQWNLYKTSYKQLFESYMKSYNPGSRVQILNNITPNSTILKKVYSNGKGC